MEDYLHLLESKLPERSDFPAVFAFSIHKAGSTMMHKMIREVCSAASIPGISIPDIMFLEGVNDWESDERLIAMIAPGRVYYGFRQLPAFMKAPEFDLQNKKSVLLVRDPRDALVSQYFSLGGRYFSHNLPDKNKDAFVEKVMATADLSIDAYVIKASNVHHQKLLAYKNNLNFGNVMLRRYEEIYFDKETFLRDIFSHFALDVDQEILKQVAADNDIRPDSEDPTKHIRKGAPGDHREKLQPETIARLNDIFRDTCSWYGYDLDA
jgi:hypothetical protein